MGRKADISFGGFFYVYRGKKQYKKHVQIKKKTVQIERKTGRMLDRKKDNSYDKYAETCKKRANVNAVQVSCAYSVEGKWQKMQNTGR